MSDPVPAASRVWVVATYLLVLLLAAELAVWGAFTVLLRVGGQPVPLGIAVAAVGNLVLGTWGGRVLGHPGGRVGPGVVWLAVALELATKRPEGDLVVITGLRGLGFLLVGFVAAVVVLVRPMATPGAPTGR